jgi:hypothetical protein
MRQFVRFGAFVADIPDVHERHATQPEQCAALIAWLESARLSKKCSVLVSMASLCQTARLARNLKVTIDLLASGKTISNVLVDGMTDGERMALLALDASNAPVAIRATAHALLNITSRHILLRALGKRFVELHGRNAREEA